MPRKWPKLNEAQLCALRDAQLRHCRDMCQDALIHGYSDDGMDYLSAACQLAHDMVTLEYDAIYPMDTDPKSNFPNLRDDYACDGVANLFYEWGLVPDFDEEDD